MVLTSVFFGANLNLIAFLSVIKEVDWKQRKFRIKLVRTMLLELIQVIVSIWFTDLRCLFYIWMESVDLVCLLWRTMSSYSLTSTLKYAEHVLPLICFVWFFQWDGGLLYHPPFSLVQWRSVFLTSFWMISRHSITLVIKLTPLLMFFSLCFWMLVKTSW